MIFVSMAVIDIVIISRNVPTIVFSLVKGQVIQKGVCALMGQARAEAHKSRFLCLGNVRWSKVRISRQLKGRCPI